MASSRRSGPADVGTLVRFFLPLSLSASMMALCQVMINGTLSRAPDAEAVIASFAIAFSLSVVFDRPNGMLRQACSLLVRDRVSYRAMFRFTLIAIAAIVGAGCLLAYTPAARWLFTSVIGVPDAGAANVIATFRLLVFVPAFSCVRSLYQGILITHRKTIWLPVGMLTRLSGMGLLAFWFVRTGQVTDSVPGAQLFVFGMGLEALVMVLAGYRLAAGLPHKLDGHSIVRKRQIWAVYGPLLVTGLIAVLIGPVINALLGLTGAAEMAIASFAVAWSVTQFIISFFYYIHQLVIQFHAADRRAVNRFMRRIGLMPAALIALVCYTPAGDLLLSSIVGLNDQLAASTLAIMQIYIVLALLFPWLDWCNGVLMVAGKAKFLIRSQAANLALTGCFLWLGVTVAPDWNGRLGAIAQSAGTAGELLVALLLLATLRISQKSILPAGESKNSPTR